MYGGAGVHVGELVRALRRDLDIEVRCFGGPRNEPGVTNYQVPVELTGANPTIETIGVDLQMAQDVAGADLVHSHTWYANGAGHIAGLLHGIPHVVTAHSLEPLRPWKAEQLGGGYRVSGWLERSAFAGAGAIIAVSNGMRNDILRSYPFLEEQRVQVVHNGIDLERWKPVEDDGILRSLGIDPSRPTVVFVGRITRQKGLQYLLKAAAQLPPDVQLVLCAGSPDTPEILAEIRAGVTELQRDRTGVVWIDRQLGQRELSAVLTAATTFVCPSIYEPLGIVNLEAMACGAPVVGTATGGIPEVVDDGVTGRLVPIEQADDGTGLPIDPDKFVDDLARILAEVVADPAAAKRMGEAGRARAEQDFDWGRISTRTQEIYRSLL
ncbi:MAG: glycosyl transferase family 1 [Microbacteriaceae bacterium]|nr:glycosyl transferase family 1 [Microbacteriaceae bacterium]